MSLKALKAMLLGTTPFMLLGQDLRPQAISAPEPRHALQVR